MLSDVLPFLARISSDVAAATGWRRLALAGVAGTISALAFPPFNAAPVLFITLPLLFWLATPGMDTATGAAGATDPRSLVAVAGRPTRADICRGLAVGWWFGFGFHFAGLYWIGGAFLVQAETFGWLLPFAIVLMPAGLAFFHAAAVAAFAVVRGGVVGRLLCLAIALTVSEWLRGHVLTGFPWNTLGYALAGPTVLLQSVSVIGIYGLTLLVLLIFTPPLVVLTSLRQGLSSRSALVIIATMSIVPLAVMLVYGAAVLSRPPTGYWPGVVLRLVQPSIPQRDKFDLGKRRDIFERHLALTRGGGQTGAAGLDGVTHVIWPEAALAFLALRTPEVLTEIAQALPDDTILIAGTLRLEGDIAPDRGRPRIFNSAMVVDGRGRVQATYDKVHLVPFGEYLPMQDFLEAIGLEQLTRIRGGFTPGVDGNATTPVPGLPPTRMLICYEVVFPNEIASSGRRPSVLLNLTNDAWYGPTSGPYQHFQQAVVRAAEQGLPLIRVGNNGITALVGPDGRVLQQLDLDRIGVLDVRLPRPRPATIYAVLGDLPALMMLVILVMIISICSCSRWAAKQD
jgi:apolipoprotein N-acyltransferase